MEQRYAKEAGIKRPLTMDALLKSAGLFYGQEKRREDGELRAAGLPFLATGSLNGGTLLRIGRHSGAESVTIEGHRYINIKQAGGRWTTMDHATTFWLVSETRKDDSVSALQPFGWVAIGKVSEEMIAAFEKREAEEQRASLHSTPELVSASSPEENPAVKSPLTIEETWDGAYVSFNAGSGGVVTAQATGGGKAELRGKDKALAAVAESLHKKLFEKPRNILKARVTIRKVGNSYEIIRVEAMNPRRPGQLGPIIRKLMSKSEKEYKPCATP